LTWPVTPLPKNPRQKAYYARLNSRQRYYPHKAILMATKISHNTFKSILNC
jgi:hypothetical protein